MRTWFRSLSLAMALSVPAAFAQVFPAPSMVFVQPAAVVAQIYNPYYENICCEGTLNGVTWNGLFRQTPFTFMVYPGTTRTVSLGTNPYYNAFANGWVVSFCRFQHP